MTRKPKRPSSWRRRIGIALKTLLVLVLLGALLGLGTFVVLYQSIDIPDENESFKAQTTFVYYGRRVPARDVLRRAEPRVDPPRGHA